MKKILEKLKMGKELIVIIVAIIGFIISAYKMYESNTNKLELINKTTLRTLIWANGIPQRDKIEACDNYLSLGYNSETKLYCEKILQNEFKGDDKNGINNSRCITFYYINIRTNNKENRFG